MPGKKIIVTGGMGYIGSHTIVALAELGYESVIIDNLSNASANVLDGIEAIIGYRPAFEKIDLRDKEATLDTFDKHGDANGVIHFAALKAVGESVAQPLRYYENNIGSLINVLEGMARNDIAHLIFSSSCTVYGQPELLPVTEDSPLQPATNPYGATKQICESIIRDIITSGNNKTSSVSLRYFNPIGAHPSSLIGELPLGIPNNLMPFITQTAIGIRDELKVFGNDYNTKDGTAIRDYIHVMDLAHAHVSALNFLISQSSPDFHVFNVGTGQGYTVLEVVQSFEKMAGIKLNYTFAERRQGDVESIYADTQKAEKVLGWKTQLSLDDMTRSSWAWEKRIDASRQQGQ